MAACRNRVRVGEVMSLANLAGMALEDIEREVARGGRFVTYEYCISVLVLSFRRSSAVQYVPPGTEVLLPGFRYTMLTLLLGWWGFPWGIIWTVQTLGANLAGGHDVTDKVMRRLRGEPDEFIPDPGRTQCSMCGHHNASTRRSCKQCQASLPSDRLQRRRQ